MLVVQLNLGMPYGQRFMVPQIGPGLSDSPPMRGTVLQPMVSAGTATATRPLTGGSSSAASISPKLIIPDRDNIDAPKHLECPLCLCIFIQPVVDACGHTYDYECIRTHLANNQRCPESRQSLRLSDLRNNLALRATIEDYLAEKGIEVKDEAPVVDFPPQPRPSRPPQPPQPPQPSAPQPSAPQPSAPPVSVLPGSENYEFLKFYMQHSEDNERSRELFIMRNEYRKIKQLELDKKKSCTLM